MTSLIAPCSSPLAYTLSFNNATGEVTITWAPPISNGSSPIVQYKIYRATSTAGPWTLQTTVDHNAAKSYTHSSNGAVYYYKIIPVTSRENRITSVDTGTIMAANVTSKPLALTATGAAPSTLLSWTPPSSVNWGAITTYKIYRGTVSGSLTYLATTPDTSPTYTDTTGAVGTTYIYAVTAQNVAGESPSSDEAAVLVVTLTRLTSSKVRFEWNVVPAGATATEISFYNGVSGEVRMTPGISGLYFDYEEMPFSGSAWSNPPTAFELWLKFNDGVTTYFTFPIPA
jgi:hypothetical protein